MDNPRSKKITMTHFSDLNAPQHEPPPFPRVEEICETVDHPQAAEDVLRRLSAPFSYLPDHERRVLSPAARVATRCMRGWIFEEPEVKSAKKRLGVLRGDESACPGSPTVSLSEFCREYATLLAESCVIQRRIAEALAAHNALTGETAYVHSVQDAMGRQDRDALLRRALALFEEVSVHEQSRFALGSSLKDLVQRELTHYPAESHQLLLTSSRGDFWSGYERDLLAYVDGPTPSGRDRLMALYFDGDDAHFEREVQRVRSLTPKVAQSRRQAQEEQQERLALARIRKVYAALGDVRLPCSGSRAKANIGHIDQLLWVDNVLEKFIDHKHLLHHDLFLRLHLVRLAIAVVLRARGIQPKDVTDEAIRDAASTLLGATISDEAPDEVREPEVAQLTAWFGEAGRAFARPDTVLRQRLGVVVWEQASARRRTSRPAPRIDETVWVAA
jgi:hypothetical protein